MTQSPTGSPPRGRGKVHNLGYEYTYLMDHPRVGGEKAKANCRHFWPVGSPPRGRGKVVAFILAYVAVGITPAWAGKSLQRSQTMKIFRDHPRVGGEKSFIHSWLSVGTGSPPRGRGKAQMDLSNLEQLRITPAWAGKSIVYDLPIKQEEDHPRVGGEKQDVLHCDGVAQGSPPRGRGKACWIAPSVLYPRITPAWAGKSLHCFASYRLPGDHPRVGGEKTKKIP